MRGSRVGRANAYAQARRRGRIRVATVRESIEHEKDVEAARVKWAALAPAIGWCHGCGAHVDEANGKLHDEHCLPAHPHRCQKGQNT